ncbi:hypothetical protein [Alcaligenes phenolicus]|uniref:hypothetical protein n=1 Tax=Alcaligenes phenolicus TaxID=232846 RepID=UPI002AA80DDA|nr:hypothetical protein [Alcaligenes phenolicus]
MGKIDHKTMCILCQTLPLSKAHTPKHDYMERVTKTEDYGDQGAQSLFRCSVCQTHWLYQQDKWKSCLGFKLWTGNVDDYLSSTRNPGKAWGQQQNPRSSSPGFDNRPFH